MPRRLPVTPSVHPLHSFEEPPPPTLPISHIESLNALDEDGFRIKFLPPDRHTGSLCCNGKVNKGRHNRHRCQNFQPAEELFITLDPAPEDSWAEDLSREDARDNGLVGVPTSVPAQYLIRFNTAPNIRPEDLESCFKLVEHTSSLDYQNSSVGWSAAKKRQEMADPDMKYLLLTTSDGPNSTAAYRVGGFLSFMLTREDELPVIYCYEIHLWPSLQGRGIGKKLMHLMEDVGQRAGVQGSMLTVFTNNEIAKKMYERMGYGVHDSSPSPRRLRRGRTKEPDYQILWKSLEGAWSDGESEESNEETSAEDEDSASDAEDEGTDVEEEMEIEEEVDVEEKVHGAWSDVENENSSEETTSEDEDNALDVEDEEMDFEEEMEIWERMNFEERMYLAEDEEGVHIVVVEKNLKAHDLEEYDVWNLENDMT